MVSHWSLCDSKSPQVSGTLPSILTVFNNAVVWNISALPPTSKSSCSFNNPFVTVPKAPITIGIIVTFMFHIFFQFSSYVEVLILLFTFFQFYSVVSRDILESFSRQRKLMVFHWSLSDSKSPQVSRTLLSILVILNNVIVWIISTRLLIFMSSSQFINSLVTVPRAITIGINVTVFSIP